MGALLNDLTSSIHGVLALLLTALYSTNELCAQFHLMRTLYTSLFAVAVTGAMAQTLPFDFESATAGMQGYDGATFTIVPNPSLVGNSSNNVAKIVKVNVNNQWAGGRIAGVTSLNFTTAETSILSMDVYTTQPVGTVIKVKLEAPYTSEVDAITTVSGGWQTLLFDFGIPAPSGSANLIIMPQPFTNGGGTTFYFDNIEQIGGSIATPLPGLPITFESGTNTDHFFSFESAQLTVVPNPNVTAANTSATVAKIVRHLGAPFGGSKITFTSPINFATHTVLTMKVWTSAPIGTNVTLKTEKPFWGVERSVQTSKTSEWETLSFDFAGSLSDMPTLVFLFDFVAGSSNVGNGSANSTFYFDDVKYAAIPLSSDELGLLNALRVAPNPTLDRWTFSAGRPIRVELCDLQGKMIAVAEGSEDVIVNAANLPSGIYVARIQSGETTVSQRVTKL
ncbi:MAG: T9SS type A sorting domain-containing protein [Cryomorphaceae bacterium]|nr:T9SS type A sorting domain-containing protein [Cryomorphaceae bacterium]